MSDPSAHASTGEFFRRAAAEGLRYGQDPWVFVRELGQNARDAGARRLDFSHNWVDGGVRLVCRDDGAGMSFQHARDYLFRLYASSKEGEADAAGQFGVGFWSVLRFLPARMEVHSNSGKESWALALRGDLSSWEKIPCALPDRGTEIVLERAEDDVAQFRKELSDALVRYLAHLRSNGRKARPLPVFLDGARKDRPFSLAGPGSLAFRGPGIDGVVGFGSRPAYQLFARGLPVAAGAYLDELEGRQRKRRKHREREGTYPVFLLNGDRLDVVLSRQTVVQNSALRKTLDLARKSFDTLIRRTVDQAAPRSFGTRLLHGVVEGARSLVVLPRWAKLWALLLLVFFSISLPMAWMIHRGRQQRTAVVAPRVAAVTDDKVAMPTNLRPPVRAPVIAPEDKQAFQTGTVDLTSHEPEWALEYHPPLPLLFRMQILGKYDRIKGWLISDTDPSWRRVPRQPAQAEEIEITVRHLDAAGRWLLPIPSGYAYRGGSARLGKRKIEVQANRQGLVVGILPAGMNADGKLHYHVNPTEGRDLLYPTRPQVRGLFPRGVRQQLAKLGPQKSEALVAWVQEQVQYERSAATARQYAQYRQKDWVRKVLGIGLGDCDVINGLLTLVFLQAGIPARLVVGLVGENGLALSGAHAWMEFEHLGRMQVRDASLVPPSASSAEPALITVAGPGSQLPARKRSARASTDAWFWYGGLALLLTAVALAIWAWLRQGRRQAAHLTENSHKQKQLLADMASSALRRPQDWNATPGLWESPFVPCLGGKTISLLRLIRLSMRDRLFVGQSGSDLAAEGVHSGAVVLDSADPAFGDLFTLLSNVRSLDDLQRYRPLAAAGDGSGFLLADLNELLQELGVEARARFVHNLGRDLLRDVDLSPIQPRSTSAWIRRFVAINPNHSWWRSLEDFGPKRRALALCVALDRLATESGLLGPHAQVLRERALSQALERPN